MKSLKIVGLPAVTLWVISMLGTVLAAELPHVLIILVDDMGYGDAACYNPQSKIATPQIDALARAGMRFTDAHAAGPLCHLSRYGLLTGRYPFRTDVGVWPRQPVIESDRLTIASLLQQRGYHTAMVGKWHLGFQEQGYDQPLPGGPVDRGFDQFFGIRASTDIPPYFYIRDDRAVTPPSDEIEANQSAGWSPIQGAFWRAGGIAPDLKLQDVLPRFTDEAIGIINHHAQDGSDKPLFLYLALPAPHTPWLPSEEFQGRSQVPLYGDFTEMVDALVGRVLKTLDDTGMSDNTLVIFSSDNGPVWYEEDVARFEHDSSGGWRGMKADAWEAGHRMPLIVRWPGHVSTGTTSDQLVSFVDVMATLAEVVELPLPEGAGPDSFSFLPVLLGDEEPSAELRQSLVLAAGNGTMTIRKGPWKLIDGLGSGGFSKPARRNPGPGEPAGQLYQLDDDPGESDNLYKQHPSRVAELMQELKRVQESGSHRAH